MAQQLKQHDFSGEITEGKGGKEGEKIILNHCALIKQTNNDKQ
jgi:hypothetical protein